MNKYVVTIHIPVKAAESGFYEYDAEYSRSYMEEVEADRFTALTTSAYHFDGHERVDEQSMPGVRFYIGDEMVAFYDASLRLSVVKGEIEEIDDERE